MHLQTRVALLLALAPNLACPMIHITNEQAESGLGTTSEASTTGTSFTSLGLSTSGSTSGADGGASGTSSTSHDDDDATTFSLLSTSDATSTSTGEHSTSDGPNCGPDDECHEGPGCNLTTCKFFCGDGIINGPPSSEQCDDGINNGADRFFAPAFCTKTCARTGRYAFITSKGDFTGQLSAHDPDNPKSGIEAADAYCSAAAKSIPDVGSDPKFVAWLSIWNKDIYEAPSTRLKDCNAPYFLPMSSEADKNTTRLLIAQNYKDLTTPKIWIPWYYLRKPFFFDEHGDKVFDASVLTGTLENGTPGDITSDCSGWTSTMGDTIKGRNNTTSLEWTNKTKSPCSDTYHLYCFEQCP